MSPFILLCTQVYMDFICRVVCAVVRERHIPRDIKHMPDKIRKNLSKDSSQQSIAAEKGVAEAGSACGDSGREESMSSLLSGGVSAGQQVVKPLPSVESGLAVFEFFSGIG